MKNKTVKSLAARILNGERLSALCVPDEVKEVRAAFSGPRVTLKRSFNQKIGASSIRFWRVIAPAQHPNYMSDLSVEGLKEWGII